MRDYLRTRVKEFVERNLQLEVEVQMNRGCEPAIRANVSVGRCSHFRPDRGA